MNTEPTGRQRWCCRHAITPRTARWTAKGASPDKSYVHQWLGCTPTPALGIYTVMIAFGADTCSKSRHPHLRVKGTLGGAPWSKAPLGPNTAPKATPVQTLMRASAPLLATRCRLHTNRSNVVPSATFQYDDDGAHLHSVLSSSRAVFSASWQASHQTA